MCVGGGVKSEKQLCTIKHADKWLYNPRVDGESQCIDSYIEYSYFRSADEHVTVIEVCLYYNITTVIWNKKKTISN